MPLPSVYQDPVFQYLMGWAISVSARAEENEKEKLRHFILNMNTYGILSIEQCGEIILRLNKDLA